MSNSVLYVITHKKFRLDPVIKSKGYELLSVGSVQGNEGKKDSSGVNISDKNSNYCELTGQYWIWKNTESSIKGFCHYRRYFTHRTLKFTPEKVYSYNELASILKREGPKAVIVPEKKFFNCSAEELYLRCGFKKDLIITGEVIKEKYPAYYEEYKRMLLSNSGYLTNMFVASSELFDSYCEWLFDVLQEVESRTNLDGYTKAEARIYGYLSERLLGVWITTNNINAIELQAINSESDNGIRYVLYRLLCSMGIYKNVKKILWKAHRALRSENK